MLLLKILFVVWTVLQLIWFAWYIGRATMHYAKHGAVADWVAWDYGDALLAAAGFVSFIAYSWLFFF